MRRTELFVEVDPNQKERIVLALKRAGHVVGFLGDGINDAPAMHAADTSLSVDTAADVDIRFIGRFMAVFGLLSSVFDFVTFAVLLWLFHASVVLFRTGWFVESLLTELVIALVVRTRRPCLQSRPGTLLLATTLAMIAITLAIPYLPPSAWLGFAPLPLGIWIRVITEDPWHRIDESSTPSPR